MTKSILGTLGVLWGVSGITILLSFAIVRLVPVARAMFIQPFVWYHWCSLGVCLIFFGAVEGYKGFQKGFSPRFAARIKYLYENPKLVLVFFSPFFGMAFFYTTRKRQIVSICLTTTIIIFIILIRLLTQPWRGIIDAGVVLGLGWGLLSLWIFLIRAFTSQSFPHSPELPEQKSAVNV